METKKLLERLDLFENLLTKYAYTELKSKDAVGLKQKFQMFKNELNSKIFCEPIKGQNKGKAVANPSILSQKVFQNAKNTVELIQSLKKTAFSQEQGELLQNVEINTLILMELSMNIQNK